MTLSSLQAQAPRVILSAFSPSNCTEKTSSKTDLSFWRLFVMEFVSELSETPSKVLSEKCCLKAHPKPVAWRPAGRASSGGAWPRSRALRYS